MGKVLIKLTEEDLHRLVSESVSSILNEIGDTKSGQFALGAVRGRAVAQPRYHMSRYGSPNARAERDHVASMANDEAMRNGKHDDKDHKNYRDAGYYYGYHRGMDLR